MEKFLFFLKKTPLKEFLNWTEIGGSAARIDLLSKHIWAQNGGPGRANGARSTYCLPRMSLTAINGRDNCLPLYAAIAVAHAEAEFYTADWVFAGNQTFGSYAESIAPLLFILGNWSGLAEIVTDLRAKVFSYLAGTPVLKNRNRNKHFSNIDEWEGECLPN